ncbi:MAG: 30S ribosomal protein S20 [Dehalococcoidales bacterium]|nr:30S ribosomal protein S20 [Dehalococcoidales bacterium]
MPVSQSAERELRASGRKQTRNKSLHSLCKTNIVKAEKVITSGDTDAAKSAVITAVSTLDRAAERGVIHRNNAARRKSRLVNKLNAVKASPAKT